MQAYRQTRVGWGELLRCTLSEVKSDDGLGSAAKLAYYFFLALFPALLFLIALASFSAHGDLLTHLVKLASGKAPPSVVHILRTQLTALAGQHHGGLLTFGAAAALWSSSAAMVALIDALNRAYDVEDGRSWLKRRGIAILLTLGLAVFLLVSITLVVAGPELASYVTRQAGLGAAVEWTWKIAQWPLVFCLIVTAFSLIYRFAPDVDQPFVWLSPGSLAATALWIGGSLGFRDYAVNFGTYNETYGTIGGVMVLLLWLYLTGLAIVIGGDMNAVLAHAAARRGEEAPGEELAPAAPERESRPGREAPPGRTVMPDYDQSLVDLIKTTVRDAQDLVRSEIALAKAEVRDEAQRLGRGVVLLAAAAVAAVLAVVFLLTTIAWGMFAWLGWPVWTGFAVVTGLMIVAAAVLAQLGRDKLAARRHLPNTTDTMKENAQWVRARTS